VILTAADDVVRISEHSRLSSNARPQDGGDRRRGRTAIAVLTGI